MTFPDVEVPLFRLDYSNEQAWNDVVHAALGDMSERTDPLAIVDDIEFDGRDIDELLARLNEDDPGYQFFVVADTRTLTETDHPFTIVTATNPPHRLQIAAHTVSDVVANLWIRNLEIEDYLTAADSMRSTEQLLRSTPKNRNARSGSTKSSKRWATVRGRDRSRSSAWVCSITAHGRDFGCSPPSSMPNSPTRTGPGVLSRRT